MLIQILGTGCPKCKTLEANVLEAVKNIGLDATIEKVTDVDKIMDMGIMLTPAIVIDGEVKSLGKVLRKDQIITLLEAIK